MRLQGGDGGDGVSFSYGLLPPSSLGEQVQIHSHTVAGSLTYGCSLAHIRLQPRSHTVAASLTYGCSLRHLRLQGGGLGLRVAFLTAAKCEGKPRPVGAVGASDCPLLTVHYGHANP